MVTDTFHIVPAAAKASWVLYPIIALVLLVGVGVPLLLWGTTRAMHDATFELSQRGLELHGEWLYRGHVPLQALDAAAARVVDLRSQPELAPRRRTMGTGLPGYGGGWFRLHNGRKALIYLTARDRVVYLPTTHGFDVMLSVTEPERMVARLHALAGGGH